MADSRIEYSPLPGNPLKYAVYGGGRRIAWTVTFTGARWQLWRYQRKLRKVAKFNG